MVEPNKEVSEEQISCEVIYTLVETFRARFDFISRSIGYNRGFANSDFRLLRIFRGILDISSFKRFEDHS